MKKSIAKLIIALLVIVTSVVVVLAGMNISIFDYNISYPDALDEDWGIRQGLDLVGGSVITYEAQTETATEEQMIGLNPLEQLNGTTSADGENIETASETQLEDMIVSGDMISLIRRVIRRITIP